jgi:hypothetical protein
MEINRASTLAKVLVRDRALEARDRKDEALKSRGLSDEQVFPGSPKFLEAVEVTVQYLSDLTDAKISSIRDAYNQTGIPLTGKTVEEGLSALRSSLDTVVSARLGSWKHVAQLLEIRNGGPIAGTQEALGFATRELNSHASRLYEKAESKLDVLLQTSLASHERNAGTEKTPSKTPRSATVIRVLIASPSDVSKERQVLTDVVYSWNAANFAATGVLLYPMKWDTHAYPSCGDRPQAIINKQIVDECDILLGVFWSRLGTPTGVAMSGTAEEIERLRKKGKKILLYFSTACLPSDYDHEQLELLRIYQRTLEKDTLYWNFADCDELFRESSRHLATIMHGLIAELKDDLGV